jgi:hypothetical protein
MCDKNNVIISKVHYVSTIFYNSSKLSNMIYIKSLLQHEVKIGYIKWSSM